MSYGGIAIWNPKYGTPQNFSEAFDMESRIRNSDIPSEYSPALEAVARAVQKFAIEASKLYDDDCLEYYITPNVAETFNGPVVWYEYICRELRQPFGAVIVTAAVEHGLVVMHNDTERVFLPDGTVYLNDRLLTNGLHSIEEQKEYWQLVFMQQAVKKVLETYIEEDNLPEIELSGCEVLFSYVADFERVRVVFDINIDSNYFPDKEGNKMYTFFGLCSVYLNDVTRSIQWSKMWYEFKYRKVELDYRTLLSTLDYHYTLLEDANCEMYVGESVNEVQAATIKAVTMFKDICAASHDLNTLFDFMHKRYVQSRFLKPTQVLQSLSVEQMLFLAKLTKQPNFSELVEFYRPLITRDDIIFLIRQDYGDDGITHDKLKEADTLQDLIDLPIGLPEESLELADKVYNEYIDYLNRLDVDKILRTLNPPHKDIEVW